jgi:tetratricopeptide (TPR) repeat protein
MSGADGKRGLGGRRRWARATAALVAGLALLAGGYLAYRATRVPVPAVDPRGADPAVAQAIETARRAVEAAPRSALAWGALGEVLLCYDFRPEAETCLARAEALDPHEPRWPYLRGVAFQTADPAAALPHLRRAAELGTAPPAVRLRLAEALAQQAESDAAAEQFRTVLAHDPDDPRAHLGLARLACDRDDLSAALPHLERAAASPQTQRQAHSLLAEVRRRLGDSAAAAHEQEQAERLPEDPPAPDPFLEEVEALRVGKQASLKLLQRLRRQGRDEDARQLADRLERRYPDVSWLVEGRVLLQKGDLAGSERAFRRATALAPDSVDAYQDLGDVCLRRHEDAEAAASFARVLELEPDYGPAHRGLAECRLRQGDRDGALRHLREAARLLPHNAEVHRELGELLARAGRTEEALAQLRQAVRLAPDDRPARDLLERVAGGKAP